MNLICECEWLILFGPGMNCHPHKHDVTEDLLLVTQWVHGGLCVFMGCVILPQFLHMEGGGAEWHEDGDGMTLKIKPLFSEFRPGRMWIFSSQCV